MEKSDRDIIFSIVSKVFEDNPRIQVMMKKRYPARSVGLLTEYAYQLVEKFNGIYLSEDKSTVLFYYKKSDCFRGINDYLKYGYMFLKAIRPSQIFPKLKREKFIRSLRADYEDYIYVWILGSVQDKTSIKGMADIRNHLFDLSEKQNLPILIETSIEKHLNLCKYVGFEIYHTWYDGETEINVWFLRWDVKSKQSTPEQ